MIHEVWTLFLHACGLLLQLLSPCSRPEILSIGNVSTEQYLGTWYFVAAAGLRDSDVDMYRPMDSTIFVLEESTGANVTFLLTGAFRVGDHCLKKYWFYHVHPGRDEMELQGRPGRRNPVWSGQWLNCSECIFLQEIEQQPPLNRVLLYARTGSVSTELIKAFQTKASCLGMRKFVILPQKKEYCQLHEIP